MRVNKILSKLAPVGAGIALLSSLPVFLLLTAQAEFHTTYPEPVGFVNDFANILDNDSALEARLKEYQEETSNEIAVATVESLDGLSVETYAVELFESWGIGSAEKDNGVLILIAPNEREMRIEVGYGLEGALTDIEAKHILDDIMKPWFKEDDYSTGVAQGVEKVIETIEGEYTFDPSTDRTVYGDVFDYDGESDWIWNFCWIIPIVAFVIIPYVGAFLGRSKSWWLGGVLGFVTGMIINAVLIALTFRQLSWFWIPIFPCAPVGLGVFGLLLDFILSKTYRSRVARGLSTGFFRSFGGFSSSRSGGFSSGGFGGFSGGSSGGGGASSSW